MGFSLYVGWSIGEFSGPTQFTTLSEFKRVEVLFGQGLYIQLEEGPGASLRQHRHALTQKEAQEQKSQAPFRRVVLTAATNN